MNGVARGEGKAFDAASAASNPPLSSRIDRGRHPAVYHCVVTHKALVAAAVAAYIVLSACTTNSDEGRATAPRATATPTPSPSATVGAAANSTVEPTATVVAPTATVVAPTAAVGPATATVFDVSVEVWRYSVPEGEVLRTLTYGDVVEIDARRDGMVRLVDGGWIVWLFTELSVNPLDLPEVRVVAHDPSTRTGVPTVDAVLDAWFAADGAAVLELAVSRELGCVAAVREPGQFACPDGAAPGTSFEVFSLAGCETPFSKGDVARFSEALSEEGDALYAVFERDDLTMIVLTDDTLAIALSLNRDGLIEYIETGCNLGPPEFLVDGATEFILAPPLAP